MGDAIDKIYHTLDPPFLYNVLFSCHTIEVTRSLRSTSSLSSLPVAVGLTFDL